MTPDSIKDWTKWKGFLFDVDGTLYSQKKMRLQMAKRLAAYYVSHPHRIRELNAVRVFRQLREQAEWKQAGFQELYREISQRISLPEDKIEKAVQYWMFQAPLDILKGCAYQDVISFVNKRHDEGTKVIIYSDYPAADKLKAMGMDHDFVFAFGVDGLSEQKPSRPVMEEILSQTGLSPEQILYVGDRDDRDRASADLVGMPYCDILEFRQLIRE